MTIQNLMTRTIHTGKIYLIYLENYPDTSKRKFSRCLAFDRVNNNNNSNYKRKTFWTQPEDLLKHKYRFSVSQYIILQFFPKNFWMIVSSPSMLHGAAVGMSIRYYSNEHYSNFSKLHQITLLLG